MPSDIRYTFAMLYQPSQITGVVPGWVIRMQFPLLAAYCAAALAILTLSYRRLEDLNEKRRLRVLLVGSMVSVLPALPLWVSVIRGFSSPLSSFFLTTPYVVAMTSLTLACPLSFAYAILRHRLFDIRVIIRRGLQYALARRVLLSLVPALGLILLGDLLIHRQPLVEVLRLRGWMYDALGGSLYWPRPGASNGSPHSIATSSASGTTRSGCSGKLRRVFARRATWSRSPPA